MLTVLLYHVGGGSHFSFLPVRAMGEAVKAGWTGVTLFFVLSGFLITGILWDTKGQQFWWRSFYARRTLRIFPLYYLSLLLVLLTAAFAGTFHTAVTRIWSMALYLQNFPGIPKRNMLYPGSRLVLRQFWSLAVEEQFYLIWPFLLLIQKDRRAAMRLCAATFFASAAFRFGVWMLVKDPEPYKILLLTRGGEMAAGGWLAMAYRDPAFWQRLRPFLSRVTVVGFAIFFATSWYNGGATDTGRWQMILGLPGITMGSAGLLALCLEEGRIARWFRLPILRWLGTISYGVYIYQLLFMSYYEELTAKLTHQTGGTEFILVRAVVTTVVTIAVAWTSYRYFERPFLKLKPLFTPRHQVAQAATVETCRTATTHVN